MPTPNPSTPPDAYRAIIDQLVNETARQGAADRIEDHGVFSKAPAHARFNQFLASLSQEHRDIVVTMLRTERSSAIHDVLAVLTWWCECKDVSLLFKGQPMPIDQSGMGLHGDYVGRMDGWSWPR